MLDILSISSQLDNKYNNFSENVKRVWWKTWRKKQMLTKKRWENCSIRCSRLRWKLLPRHNLWDCAVCVCATSGVWYFWICMSDATVAGAAIFTQFRSTSLPCQVIFLWTWEISTGKWQTWVVNSIICFNAFFIKLVWMCYLRFKSWKKWDKSCHELEMCVLNMWN